MTQKPEACFNELIIIMDVIFRSNNYYHTRHRDGHRVFSNCNWRGLSPLKKCKV